MTREIADRALVRLGVDDLGLDGADRRYLRLLAESYGGGPVGVETIAAALSEVRDAIEEVIEPYLLAAGADPADAARADAGGEGLAAPRARAAAAGGAGARPVRRRLRREKRVLAHAQFRLPR